MVTRITQPVQPIVNERREPSNEFNAWIQVMTNRTLFIGTGSPEAVVSSLAGAIYMNDAGTAGSILYVKRDDDDGAGDTTIGWILV